MDDLKVFCRQVRSRSSEHRESIRLLSSAGIFSQVVSILRQELDSMIRVIFLLTIRDKMYRKELVKKSIEGRQWTAKDTEKKVTDRDMVDISNRLHGWTRSVYKFGCAFVHLSSFHDYRDREPMDMISPEEKEDIVYYLRYYHGGPVTDDPGFNDLIPFLPHVFDKISSNLEAYLCDLEKKKQL